MSALEACKRVFFGETPLLIARSLRDEPAAWIHDSSEWRREPYKLHHRGGVALWIANGSYGMQVRVGDRLSGEAQWGGVTMISTFGLSPGHHLLRRAADKWLLFYGPLPMRSAEVIAEALSTRAVS